MCYVFVDSVKEGRNHRNHKERQKRDSDPGTGGKGARTRLQHLHKDYVQSGAAK